MTQFRRRLALCAFGVAAVAPAVLQPSVAAACVSIDRRDEITAWQTWTVTNRCAGAATVNYTETYQGKTKHAYVFVSGCSKAGMQTYNSAKVQWGEYEVKDSRICMRMHGQ